MAMSLIEALKTLDPENNDHWTSDGLPRLDVLKNLTGTQVTREQITAEAKSFNRKSPTLDSQETKPAETPEAPQAPVEASKETPAETPDEDDSDEPVDLSDEEAVEKEMQEAQEALTKAQKRHRAAVEAMDVVIAKRDARNASKTTATDIKAFQKSQQAQREAEAKKKAALDKFLSSQK